jgi:hypothetical protein
MEIAMLGKRTDAAVAGLTRWTIQNVRHKRRTLSIPAPELRRWNQEELALLGKLSDEEVARRINRPLSAVIRARMKRKIQNAGDIRSFPLRPS